MIHVRSSVASPLKVRMASGGGAGRSTPTFFRDVKFCKLVVNLGQ